MKNRFRKFIPTVLLQLYNRVISKRIIRKKTGDWFYLNWKKDAPDSSESFWVQSYDKAWKHHQPVDLSSLDVACIKEQLPERGTILDAGCGDGILLNEITGDRKSLVGVDLSRTAIFLARNRLGSNAVFVQSFLEHLPFADNSFDVVLSAHTLEHVKELGSVIDELKRVARKRLIVLVPSQEPVHYSMDYHLHYFREENQIVDLFQIPTHTIKTYTVPSGECDYSGKVILYRADFDVSSR